MSTSQSDSVLATWTHADRSDLTRNSEAIV
jgi:hypothetical protein